MARAIEVVAYSPGWPAAYEAEARRLREVFGEDLLAVHHIGSTAVPGLAAKPIIDILVTVRDIRRIRLFDEGMAGLGYRVRGECLDSLGSPGRFYYSRDADGVRTHQVHAMQEGHFEIRQKRLLCDYLRACPAEAAAYGQLKMELAAANTRGIVEYIEGKDAFVKALIGRAEAWAGVVAAPATNDLSFLLSLREDLARCGVEVWVFGGWAEQLRGLRPAGPHGDVDLLYPATDFLRIDALFRAYSAMVEIPQKRFSHKRAAEYRGVRVEFLLLEPDGDGHVTRFFDGRYVHRWPADTLTAPLVAVADRRLAVASPEALGTYREAHRRAIGGIDRSG